MLYNIKIYIDTKGNLRHKKSKRQIANMKLQRKKCLLKMVSEKCNLNDFKWKILKQIILMLFRLF